MLYRPKTKPFPHQKRALRFLLEHRGGGLQVPMRYGKSKVAIDFSSAAHLKWGVRRVLVVTITSALGVWEDEVEVHSPLDFQVLDWHGEILKQSSSKPDIQYMLVNFANVYDRAKHGGRSWSAVPRDILRKFDPDVVVVDESHHIGNTGSAQFKMTNLLGKNARFRVIMTGTMFHRKPLYVFGQIKFLDHGRSLGTSKSHFEQRITVKGGFEDYQIIRYKNLKWMIKQVKKNVLIEKPVPGLPPVVNKVPFRLQGDNLAAYQKMEKDRLLVVKGEAIMSPLVITRHMRLHMIEGGWVKQNGKYVRVGSDKVNVMQDRLQMRYDEGREQIVVACRFIPELADVARAAKAVGYRTILFHGGLDAKQRTKRIKEFQTGKHPTVFISQIATGSQGIDLSIADLMVFYSLTESYMQHDQMSQRIAKYKDKRTLEYDFIVARGRRGDVLFRSLQLKKDVAEFIAQKPRLVEKITRIDDHEVVWVPPAHLRSKAA